MAQELKICPVCETRNKVTWDFCVKCGESLTEVSTAADAVETAAAGAAAKGEAGVRGRVEGQPEERGGVADPQAGTLPP